MRSNVYPTYHSCTMRLGLVREREGQASSALPEYQAALHIDPYFKPAQDRLRYLQETN